MRVQGGIAKWFLVAPLGAAAVLGVGALVASGDSAPSTPAGVRDPADTGVRASPAVPEETSAGPAADAAARRALGPSYVENGVMKRAFTSDLPELDPSASKIIDDPKNKGKTLGMAIGPNGKLVVTGIWDDRPKQERP